MRGQKRHPPPPFQPQHQPKPGQEGLMRPRPQYQASDYKPAQKLAGRTAIITGGDSGIGRAVALLYAREGADVAIVCTPHESEDAAETRGAIEDLGRKCLVLEGDVSDPDFCLRAVDATVEQLGHLDILVNNAAYQQHIADIEDVTLEQWDKTFKVNIYGYFYMVRAAVNHLPRGGVILNCSSITGLEGHKGLLDYASTKGAINAFTKSLAQMLVDKGIRVNAVAPGPVWTPLQVSDQPREKVPEFGANTPYERPAQPEEIAPAFVFLASNADSSYITGEVLSILGGETTAA